MTSRGSFTDRVEAFFKAQPWRWIPAIEFEAVGGRQAWRTRLSNCRTKRGMTIQNRQRTVQRDDGSTYVCSEYRYVPSTIDQVSQDDWTLSA